MKQCVEVLKDSFVDYAGKTHQFVIAAVSESLTCDGDTPVVLRSQGFETELIGSVCKGIKIGVAICNPEDPYSEKTGVLKATHRAKNADYSLFASDQGFVNSPLVRAFLQQEAEYLKSNPDKYIKGYSESEARFLKRKEMEGIKENFTEVEKIVVEGIQKDPKFLDNVQMYLEWMKNQEKGKCKKQKK